MGLTRILMSGERTRRTLASAPTATASTATTLTALEERTLETGEEIAVYAPFACARCKCGDVGLGLSKPIYGTAGTTARIVHDGGRCLVSWRCTVLIGGGLYWVIEVAIVVLNAPQRSTAVLRGPCGAVAGPIIDQVSDLHRFSLQQDHCDHNKRRLWYKVFTAAVKLNGRLHRHKACCNRGA